MQLAVDGSEEEIQTEPAEEIDVPNRYMSSESSDDNTSSPLDRLMASSSDDY